MKKLANMLLDAKIYARISGAALAATALLGIVMQLVNDGGFVAGFLEFDWTHNVLHVVLATAALVVGFAAGGSYAKLYARVFGAVYVLLAILGFVSADVLGFLGVHLELGENLVHALIGGWGLAVGFLKTAQTVKVAPATTRRA